MLWSLKEKPYCYNYWLIAPSSVVLPKDPVSQMLPKPVGTSSTATPGQQQQQ
jgi:hypothetical protein